MVKKGNYPVIFIYGRQDLIGELYYDIIFLGGVPYILLMFMPLFRII